MRMRVVSVVAWLVAGIMASAQGQVQNLAPAGPPWVPLWANGAPGALGTALEDTPAIQVFLPASNPTKTAVIVMPGGGYGHWSYPLEGGPPAQWLQAHGIAAFVLRYRLGPKYHHPIQLHDAQRAIRTIRARAAEYGIDPHKVGVMGFSAGGHLASTTGTHFDMGLADAADAVDRQGSRPDFMVLAYAVISMQPALANGGSLTSLLGDHPDPALVKDLSNELQVTHDTPPTFIYQTGEDKSVPPENAIVFYQAMLHAHVPGELHLFQHGPHATGLGQKYADLKVWPDLLLHWMQGNGWAQ